MPGLFLCALVYLVTHIVTFRAPQNAHGKAQFAGNVGYLSKNWNAATGFLRGSLRASRHKPAAALRILDVAPLCLRIRALLQACGDSLNVTI